MVDQPDARKIRLDDMLPGLHHVTVREALVIAIDTYGPAEVPESWNRAVEQIEQLEAQRQAAEDAVTYAPLLVTLRTPTPPAGTAQPVAAATTVVLEVGKWYAIKGFLWYSSIRGRPSSYPVARYLGQLPPYVYDQSKAVQAQFELWPADAARKLLSDPRPRDTVRLPVNRITAVVPYDDGSAPARTGAEDHARKMIEENYARYREQRHDR